LVDQVVQAAVVQQVAEQRPAEQRLQVKAIMVAAQPAMQLNIRAAAAVVRERLAGMLQILLRAMVEMAQLRVIAVHQSLMPAAAAAVFIAAQHLQAVVRAAAVTAAEMEQLMDQLEL
jgi:folate-dependent phosphoribosylglycinamide formyltransferase PurN